MAAIEHRTVSIAAVDVHLAEVGDGPPLLLLHGWPQHGGVWLPVVPLLAGEFRLLMPDLRGFGSSSVPDAGIDSAHFAEDAVALLDALGLERVGVVGHDWGGFTAYLLGLQHPERLTGLVVCNSPIPWARLSARSLLELWRLWYVLLVASPIGARVVASRGFVPWFVRLGGRAHVFDDAEAERFAAPLREPARARASQALYRHYLTAATQIFLRRVHRGRRLTVPTRAVFGAEDFYVAVANTLGGEQHADDWRLHLLDGVGHWTPQERPDVVAHAARDLFSRSGGR